MSWFPDEFEACRHENTPHAEPAAHAGQELAPGVRVERAATLPLPRRGFLGFAALLAGAGTLRGQSDRRPRTQTETAELDFGPITLEEFVKQAEPIADALVSTEKPNEDAYLMHLASLLCRIAPLPAQAQQESERPIQMKRRYRGTHFAAIQIHMDEGAALPFHDHYEYNGAILGLEGTVHARNFEMVDADRRPPEDATFAIRETVRATLTPGRISTLSRRRDNIHDLRGGKGGGRLLDIFTFFPSSQGSKYLEVEDEPIDADHRIYQARWRNRQRGG